MNATNITSDTKLAPGLLGDLCVVKPRKKRFTDLQGEVVAIKRYKDLNKLTTAGLSHRTGVSETVLTRVMSGRSRLTLWDYVKVANFLRDNP